MRCMGCGRFGVVVFFLANQFGKDIEHPYCALQKAIAGHQEGLDDAKNHHRHSDSKQARYLSQDVNFERHWKEAMELEQEGEMGRG